MTLPTYDKSKRKKSFEQLPKGAYVIKILGVRREKNSKNEGEHLTIAFDIAEGEYKGFYNSRFEQSKANSENTKWPNDAIFYLTIPADNSPQYVTDNWNTFFADLEDSNNGFVFSGDIAPLKNKIIGGKFAIEQSEWNGKVYNHTKMRWTCVADDVRNDKAGTLPQDKLIAPGSGSGASRPDANDFIKVPDGTEEELPF